MRRLGALRRPDPAADGGPAQRDRLRVHRPPQPPPGRPAGGVDGDRYRRLHRDPARGAAGPGPRALPLHLRPRSASASCCFPSCPSSGRTSTGPACGSTSARSTFQPGELAKIALAIFFASYMVERADLLSPGHPADRPVPGPRPPVPGARPGRVGPVAPDLPLRERPGVVVPLLRPVHRHAVDRHRAGLLPGPRARSCSPSGRSFALKVIGHAKDRVQDVAQPVAQSTTPAATRSSRAGSPSPPAGIFGDGPGPRAARSASPRRPPTSSSPSSPTSSACSAPPPSIAAFLLMVGSGLRIAMRCERPFEKLLATGLSIILGVQTFVIIGGVTRIIPLTGITLPFVSYGGSSLIANYILLALLLRISHDSARRRPSRRSARPTRVGRLTGMNRQIRLGGHRHDRPVRASCSPSSTSCRWSRAGSLEPQPAEHPAGGLKKFTPSGATSSPPTASSWPIRADQRPVQVAAHLPAGACSPGSPGYFSFTYGEDGRRAHLRRRADGQQRSPSSCPRSLKDLTVQPATRARRSP